MFKVYMCFARDSRYPLIAFKTRENAEQWIETSGYLTCYIWEMYVEE